MSELETLDWEGLSDFYYKGLMKKKEIADGSCYFHCIADSFYKPYQLGDLDKKQYITNLRKDLAKNLTPVIYEKLSRGQLKEFSKKVPGFSLKDMKAILESNQYVDNRFNEYISNTINKDIYIINYEEKKVYITGKDDDILYKNRDSIVMIWINKNHFDLACVLEGRKLITLFKYNHPFIQKIRENMKRQIKN